MINWILSRFHNNDTKACIRLIPFQAFCDCGMMPRYPDNKDLCVELEDINRDDSFIVFISHRWLRGHDGTDG